MPQRNMPRSAAVYGIDIGKNSFHVVGLGSDGVQVQKVRCDATRCCNSLSEQHRPSLAWDHALALIGLPESYRRWDIGYTGSPGELVGWPSKTNEAKQGRRRTCG